MGGVVLWMEVACEGRVAFLAGCKTAKISDRHASSFLAKAAAAALVGYGREVDWLESAQMDLIVLGTKESSPQARARPPLT